MRQSRSVTKSVCIIRYVMARCELMLLILCDCCKFQMPLIQRYTVRLRGSSWNSCRWTQRNAPRYLGSNTEQAVKW